MFVTNTKVCNKTRGAVVSANDQLKRANNSNIFQLYRLAGAYNGCLKNAFDFIEYDDKQLNISSTLVNLRCDSFNISVVQMWRLSKAVPINRLYKLRQESVLFILMKCTAQHVCILVVIVADIKFLLYYIGFNPGFPAWLLYRHLFLFLQRQSLKVEPDLNSIHVN